jgi:hypothetical protein
LKRKELGERDFWIFLKNEGTWRFSTKGGYLRELRGGRGGLDRSRRVNRFELRIYYTREYSIEVTSLSRGI